MINATPTASPDSAPDEQSDEVAALIGRLSKWLSPSEIEKRARFPYRTFKRWQDIGAPPAARAVMRLQQLEREIAQEFKRDFTPSN